MTWALILPSGSYGEATSQSDIAAASSQWFACLFKGSKITGLSASSFSDVMAVGSGALKIAVAFGRDGSGHLFTRIDSGTDGIIDSGTLANISDFNASAYYVYYCHIDPAAPSVLYSLFYDGSDGTFVGGTAGGAGLSALPTGDGALRLSEAFSSLGTTDSEYQWVAWGSGHLADTPIQNLWQIKPDSGFSGIESMFEWAEHSDPAANTISGGHSMSFTGSPSWENLSPTNVTVTPTGLSMSMSLGTPVVTVSEQPAGFAMAMSLGVLTIQVDTTIVGIAGYAMTMALGTPTIRISSGQVDATVTPPGLGMTMSLGTPIVVGTGTQKPSGFAMSMSLGTPTIVIPQNVTVVPTGLPMTMSLGTPLLTVSSATIIVKPAGLAMTMSLGTPAVYAQQVSKGQRAMRLGLTLGL